MLQVDESIKAPSLVGKTREEIIAHFDGYKFRDSKGHDLILCSDFLDIVSAISSDNNQS